MQVIQTSVSNGIEHNVPSSSFKCKMKKIADALIMVIKAILHSDHVIAM